VKDESLLLQTIVKRGGNRGTKRKEIEGTEWQKIEVKGGKVKRRDERGEREGNRVTKEKID